MTAGRFVQVVTVLAAMSMLVTGMWARVDPVSFAEWAWRVWSQVSEPMAHVEGAAVSLL